MAVAQPVAQMMGGQPGMMVQPGPMATGIDIFGQLQGVGAPAAPPDGDLQLGEKQQVRPL